MHIGRPARNTRLARACANAHSDPPAGARPTQ